MHPLPFFLHFGVTQLDVFFQEVLCSSADGSVGVLGRQRAPYLSKLPGFGGAFPAVGLDL